MPGSKEKNDKPKYFYYVFIKRFIAREVCGNRECASTRFEFYLNGEWINNYDLSLGLSDAVHDFGDFTVCDYEEVTEEEAMRRIAESDK